jgi:hypothetical protein
MMGCLIACGLSFVDVMLLIVVTQMVGPRRETRGCTCAHGIRQARRAVARGTASRWIGRRRMRLPRSTTRRRLSRCATCCRRRRGRPRLAGLHRCECEARQVARRTFTADGAHSRYDDFSTSVGKGECTRVFWPDWIYEHWDLDAELDGWRWPRWARRNRCDGLRRGRQERCTVTSGQWGSPGGRGRTGCAFGRLLIACSAATLFWTGVTRYGEARHPGPAPNAATSTGAGTVVYPRPLRPGFRDVRCSGFGRAVPGEAPLEGKFQLEIETVNATAWRSAVRRLERSSAQVVLVQETRVLRRDVPRFSAQARRKGWQTLWSPAVPGKRGKASGGVAICARLPVS